MNKNLKIGMLLGNSFPPEIRLEKEARTLTQAGFEVHLLCTSQTGSEQTFYYSMRIHRIKLPRIKLLRQLSFFIFHLTFVNYIWYREIIKFITNNNINVLHVHDLPLVYTAIKVKNKFPNLKIIADLHENYPAALQEWVKFSTSNLLQSLILKYLYSYQRWYKHEKIILEKADKILVVVEEMKTRLIQSHSISSNKITIISNLEDTSFVTNAIIDDTIIKKYNRDFIICYIGGFGSHRGIDTAINGMNYLYKYNDIKLLLIGKGTPVFTKYLHQIINKNTLGNCVTIIEWQPFAKVYSYMSASQVCIVPHNMNDHTNNTIPHKLFQYMLAGKPLLVSTCKPLARIVSQLNSGLVFIAGDPQDFANKILFLYHNQRLRYTLGINGKNATLFGKFNWDEEGKKLINLYQSFC